MNPLHFTTRTVADGIVEREFTLGAVTGVLWSAESGPDRAPLVLLCHGGGTHRKAPAMLGRSRLLVRGCGFHVAVIDAPGHGGRPRTPHDEREIDLMLDALDAREPIGPIVTRYNAHLAELALPEWRVTLDALQQLPEIGPDGPVGYWGVNLGTAIGIPLIAAEPRITAAVLGQFWHTKPLDELARRITVPIEFALQWDDEHVPRESGLALFDAFASPEKSLHVNSGKHKEVPRFEDDSAARFLARHLSAG